MRILLVIGGSIAAYKSLELIRLLRRENHVVDAVLTDGGAQFITALSVSSLTGRPTYDSLFSLKDEVEMGHIRLTREADMVLVAPASADLIAKLATGRADDLASATLLASDKQILLAPAMNAKMWDHPATRRNIDQVIADGCLVINPDSGSLACGEVGSGRMAEPETILRVLQLGEGRLVGKKAIVTAGPTHEPLDPVRYLGNRSSGRQGYAIAMMLALEGADVTLVSGPVALEAPPRVKRVMVETADEMAEAVESVLPADIFVGAAAVADWRPKEASPHKMKKRGSAEPPMIALVENRDILAMVAASAKRPALVIGFAAESESLLANARAKRQKKGADWLLANSIADGAVFGAKDTALHFLSQDGDEEWGNMDKTEAASMLTQRIVNFFIQDNSAS